MDDNLRCLDHFLVFVLLACSVVTQGHVEIFDVDVLQDSQYSQELIFPPSQPT